MILLKASKTPRFLFYHHSGKRRSRQILRGLSGNVTQNAANNRERGEEGTEEEEEEEVIMNSAEPAAFLT